MGAEGANCESASAVCWSLARLRSIYKEVVPLFGRAGRAG